MAARPKVVTESPAFSPSSNQMKRLYITFSGAAYSDTTAKIVARGSWMGADEVVVYDDQWLMEQPLWQDQRFQWLYNHVGHKNPAGYRRGFGWFAWKPVVIADALRRCQPGDIVLYSDADTFPIKPFGVLYDECKRRDGMLLFSAVGCSNQNWTKRDCLIAMGMDEDRWRFCQHAVARFMLFEAGNRRANDFLAEWAEFCLDKRCQTFDASTLAPEYPELHEHRTEQSIFTLLAHKYGEKLYREACQFGNSVDDDKELYGQLFEQVGSDKPKRHGVGSAYRNA